MPHKMYHTLLLDEYQAEWTVACIVSLTLQQSLLLSIQVPTQGKLSFNRKKKK